MARFGTENTTEPLLGPDDAANLRAEFAKVRDDLAAVRTALIATHTKLDADAGVSDTDYDTNDPAALTSADLTEK